MDVTRIEEYVNCLLESWAVYNSGEELVVWQTLHDLLMAVSRFELMSGMHKEMTTQLCKKLQHHFETKFVLKERKETKKKKNFPPNPLLKEKAKKETEEKKGESVGDAKSVFHEECLKYVGQFDNQRLADFYHYWSEEDKNGKMRFQYERCWNTEKRLKRWMTTSYNIANTAAAIRLQKLKQTQQSKESVAQERNEANDRLWQEIEERKKNAVSHEEWLASKKRTTN